MGEEKNFPLPIFEVSMTRPNKENDELALIHYSRGGVYKFCGKCFIGIPDGETYKRINNFLPGLSEMVSVTDNKDIIEGAAGLKKFIETRNKMKEKELAEYDLETLRKYTSMFCVKGSVQTDESYYTSTKQLLMQESRDEMLKLLHKYGFNLTEDVREYEDHISVELAFMSALAFNSADALQNGNIDLYTDLLNEQYNFHETHFKKWTDKFFDQIINSPIPDELLFTSIAKFTKGFIAEDEALLAELTTFE